MSRGDGGANGWVGWAEPDKDNSPGLGGECKGWNWGGRGHPARWDSSGPAIAAEFGYSDTLAAAHAFVFYLHTIV